MLRKSFWILKGKPIQSALHILLMVIIAFTLLTGFIFKDTGEFITSGGTFYYTVSVKPKDPESSISRGTIEKLADDPDIVGYNYNITQEAEPENFKNWVEYYKNDYSAYVNSVEISINLNVGFSDIFADNTAELINGRFPDKDEYGVIIEQKMADHNDIRTGDILKVKITDGDDSILSFKVLGIYQLKSPIENKEYIGNELANIVSPYTRLYTNIESIVSGQSDIPIKYVNFYTLKEESVSAILSDFNIKLDYTLEASDSTDTKFVVLNQAVNSMTQYYNWIIYALILTSLLIFILFSVYTQHNNIYETAVLSVLGRPKRDILLQNLLNVLILSVVSNVISTIIALAFSNSVGLFWISMATRNYTIGVSNFSFQTEQTALFNNYTINNLGIKIVVVTSAVFFISLFIALAYSLSILRLTPQERLDRAN
jgi:hypothetical protein